MLPLSGPGTDTGTSSPMTPMINATAPTSRINLFKFICWVCPLGPVRNHVETGLGDAATHMFFLFGVVAVA